MKIYAVGLGPGDAAYLAPRAREVLTESDVIAGYAPYLDLIPELTQGKSIISTGMRGEAERCEAAVRAALTGKKVSVVSGGDPGIYGMASLLYELAAKTPGITAEVEVIPGITAAAAAAAALGAPLSNDFAVISLSSLLTPWDVIEKRLDAVSSADMAVCLYNPQSHTRSGCLRRACEISMRYKPPGTWCGYVRNAFRDGFGGSRARICTLQGLTETEADMFTTVIIGNSATRVINGALVTARGYHI